MEMKIIKLKADTPFYNNVDIAIMDYGGRDGKLRTRGKITVDFSEYDIKLLKEDGIDTLEKALAHYKKIIYATVRRYILSEFDVEDGWEPILEIIKEHIKKYYE